MKPTTFAQCMDVFDWYDDDLYEYLTHIWLSKLDANARIAHAAELIATHADTDEAYPVEFLNQPA